MANLSKTVQALSVMNWARKHRLELHLSKKTIFKDGQWSDDKWILQIKEGFDSPELIVGSLAISLTLSGETRQDALASVIPKIQHYLKEDPSCYFRIKQRSIPIPELFN